MAKEKKPKSKIWEEAEAAGKPGAVRCGYCKYYACRCAKGIKR